MATFSMCIQVSFLIIMLAFPLFSGTNSAEISDITKPTLCNKNPTFGCPKNHRPVCASNGVTYSNLCTFCKANRKSYGKITFKHNGSCRRILSTGGTRPRGGSEELLRTAA
ncbi:serine protease inhibitor Kazal-type 1-like isoform X2 [Saccopteryx bilineata]|uniref:serine protease inhibitor Kazal-type 1-like isoform X2 n=1 Tax=Saccopteryx bilineata TaxID=59482 RepID=UPI00338D683F